MNLYLLLIPELKELLIRFIRCNVVLSSHCKNSSCPEICFDCSPYAFDSLLCKFEVKGGDFHG